MVKVYKRSSAWPIDAIDAIDAIQAERLDRLVAARPHGFVRPKRLGTEGFGDWCLIGKPNLLVPGSQL